MRVCFSIFALILLPCSFCSAAAVSVGTLPPSAYVDTEVSTNFPFVVDYARLKNLHLALEMMSSTSNSVEVLIGCDRNSDGYLSCTEASLAFGYDCGTWFVREAESDQLQIEVASAADPVRREVTIGWRNVSPAWNLMRVTRRGEGAVNESLLLTIENKKFAVIVR